MAKETKKKNEKTSGGAALTTGDFLHSSLKVLEVLARGFLEEHPKFFTLCSCLAVESRGRGRKGGGYLSMICTPDAVSTI